jgi:hypothetical protein
MKKSVKGFPGGDEYVAILYEVEPKDPVIRRYPRIPNNQWPQNSYPQQARHVGQIGILVTRWSALIPTRPNVYGSIRIIPTASGSRDSVCICRISLPRTAESSSITTFQTRCARAKPE